MEDVASSEQRFSPFASELDWRVARWAVQEGVGHKLLDQLLAIPRASDFLFCFFFWVCMLIWSPSPTQVVESLGLSYHNTCKLHQVIDGIISWVEWKTQSLWFKTDPQAKHYIHYRNPLDAIQSLLENPAHANHIIYKPKKIFVNAKKEKRIYHEMWTGRWWNTVQVCTSFICTDA